MNRAKTALEISSLNMQIIEFKSKQGETNKLLDKLNYYRNSRCFDLNFNKDGKNYHNEPKPPSKYSEDFVREIVAEHLSGSIEVVLVSSIIPDSFIFEGKLRQSFPICLFGHHIYENSTYNNVTVKARYLNHYEATTIYYLNNMLTDKSKHNAFIKIGWATGYGISSFKKP